MKPHLTILVLDGQTNQALACVRSLGRAGHRVMVASHHPWPLAAWSRYCVRGLRIAAQTREAFADLRAQSMSAEVNIVLPITERSCLLCNEERAEWEAAGIKIGCAETSGLMSAFDKAQTLQQAELCGVRIPPTRYPRSKKECLEAAEQVGWPCVIKPRRSNAWNGETFLPDRGCAYAGSVDELSTAVEVRRQDEDWPLIQGYVKGRGKGAFALCDRGRIVAWFAHERLRDVNPTGSGSSLRRSTPLDQRLCEPAARLLSAMQWHGPAMVEFRDDGVEAPCLMEVNGRFWGSLQLAIDAGVDFPRLWIDIIRGAAIEPIEGYDEQVTLRWLWGDFKRLLHIYRGRPAGYRGEFPTRRRGWQEFLGAQPSGTRLEAWRADDRWPGVGEWFEGLRQMLMQSERISRWHESWHTRIQTGRTTASLLSKSG